MPSMNLFKRRDKSDDGPSDDNSEQLARAVGVTRRSIFGKIGSILGQDQVTTATWENLEEVLIGADVGVQTALSLVERVKSRRPYQPEDVRALLREELIEILNRADHHYDSDNDTLEHQVSNDVRKPYVILVVGVNGTGKTTMIGRIAAKYIEESYVVMAAAADTYRAAAIEQLETWGDIVGFDVISQQTGADPAAVAFDAINAAKARDCDLVIIDTAGRLQNKTSLMDELAKIKRVINRQLGRDLDEVLLVLDATTGQNGLNQAGIFMVYVGVKGVALSKLDGAGKGGLPVAIAEQYSLPVKFVGTGEKPGDIALFDPEVFVDALLTTDEASD